MSHNFTNSTLHFLPYSLYMVLTLSAQVISVVTIRVHAVVN